LIELAEADSPDVMAAMARIEQSRALRAVASGEQWPAVDAVGSFYRPAMMTSIALLFLAFSDWYPGWAAASLVMHLANVCLVVLLVRRLMVWSAQRGAQVRVPILVPALAAILFGLNPVIMEGVAWLSARADLAVTLFSLAGAWFWAGRPASSPDRQWSAWMLPLLLVPALGFKESAIILPLQILCLALVWHGPLGRHRLGALLLAGLIAIGFMGLRAVILGNPIEVGADGAGTLASLSAWWTSLFAGHAFLAAIWLISLVLLFALIAAFCRGPQLRMSLGLIAAGGGLALATLLSLGTLEASGEGGRLAYGPAAWIIVGLGVGLGAGLATRPRRSIVRACMAVSVLLGSILASQQIEFYRAVQDSVRNLVDAVPQHAQEHPGLTLLLVPDTVGFVVAFRNAQGGIVMPPLQDQPLLHRVLPTLPDEIEARQQQLAAGLATRLAQLPPATLDDDALASLFAPAEPGAPDHVACWDALEGRLLVITVSAADWHESMRAIEAACPL
ncbi:MAG: hypothetical protein ACNA7J_06935, partial [Wenzhouxiangella sp.]